jgi:hypothetical protein
MLLFFVYNPLGVYMQTARRSHQARLDGRVVTAVGIAIASHFAAHALQRYK